MVMKDLRRSAVPSTKHCSISYRIHAIKSFSRNEIQFASRPFCAVIVTSLNFFFSRVSISVNAVDQIDTDGSPELYPRQLLPAS